MVAALKCRRTISHKLRRTLIRPIVTGDEDTGAARSSLKTATHWRIPRNHHRRRALIRPRVIGDEDTGAGPTLKTAAAWRIPRNHHRGRALIRPRVIGVEDARTIDSLKTATTRQSSRRLRKRLTGHQRSSGVHRVDRTWLRCREAGTAAGYGHRDESCHRNDSHLSLHVHHRLGYPYAVVASRTRVERFAGDRETSPRAVGPALGLTLGFSAEELRFRARGTALKHIFKHVFASRSDYGDHLRATAVCFCCPQLQYPAA